MVSISSVIIGYTPARAQFSFNYPVGIAAKSSGSMLIANTPDNTNVFMGSGEFIRKWGSLCNLQNGTGCIDPDGAGPLSRGDGQFNYPALGYYSGPIGIATDSSGSVIIADTGNDRIQKFTNNGSFLTKWGSSGIGNGQFGLPDGVAVDSFDNVYVVDYKNHRIQEFMNNGTFIGKWGSPCNLQTGAGCIDPDGAGPLSRGDGQFNYPIAIAIDSMDNVYVAEAGNNRIQKFHNDGTFIRKWGSPCNLQNGIGCIDPDGTGPLSRGDGQFYAPAGIATDSSGNVYVIEYVNNRIQEFTNDGTFIRKWGSFGTGDGQFMNPQGLGVDFIDNVYVGDTFSNRIQKFQNDGTFIRKWGSLCNLQNGTGCIDPDGAGPLSSGDGQFWLPTGIGIDSSGNVYVGDYHNNRIQAFR